MLAAVASVASVVGAVAVALLLLLPPRRLAVRTYRAVNWMKRVDPSHVASWTIVRVEGKSTSVLKIHTPFGTYHAPPHAGRIVHVESVPCGDALSLAFTYRGRVHAVVVPPPFRREMRIVGGRFHVVVEPHPVQPEWDIASDFEEVVLPNGSHLLSDVRRGAVSALLLPGRARDFRCRDTLDFFRDRGVRIHVLYYESHTYARKEGEAECAFPSGSFERSLTDMRAAMRRTSATVVVGYSLGGLLATLYATRHPVERLVLLAPLLSFADTAAENLDTWHGQAAVRCAGAVASALATSAVGREAVAWLGGARWLPSPPGGGRARKIGLADLDRYTHPLVHEVQRRETGGVQGTFLRAATSAMVEVQSATKKIAADTLVVLPVYDRVVSPAATRRVVDRVFARATVHEVALDHTVWPCRTPDEMRRVYALVDAFLGSPPTVSRAHL